MYLLELKDLGLKKNEELRSVIEKIKKYRLPWGGKRPRTEEIEPELTHLVLYLRFERFRNSNYYSWNYL